MRSVDAVKDSMIQNSHEFLGLPNETSTNLHKRRISYRGYNQNQSPKVVVMGPAVFLRRNNSGSKNEIYPEFKLSARSDKNKPLSLMQSKNVNTDIIHNPNIIRDLHKI